MLACVAIAFTCWACHTPSAPNGNDGGENSGAVRVTGSERLAWEQAASDEAALSQLSYVVYVDSVRVPLSAVNCTKSTNGFTCQAPIPALSLGTHTLALATWMSANGSVLESDRSSTITVTRAASATALQSSSITANAFSLERVASGLTSVSSMAAAPDGRLFVTANNRVIVVDHGQIQREPALTLRNGCELDDNACDADIALSPGFLSNRLVFVAQTIVDDHGRSTRVTRYRELNGILGEAAIIRDFPVGPTAGRARVRFGPDAMLYVSIAGPADQNVVGAYEGSIIRLTPEGATPRDNPGGSPILSSGHANVRAMEWDKATSSLWTVETAGSRGSATRSVAPVARVSAAQLVSTARSTGFLLQIPTDPSALGLLTVKTDNAAEVLLTGNDQSQSIFRIQLPGLSASSAGSANGFEGGSVFEIAFADDGWIYFSTRSAAVKESGVGPDTIWRVQVIR